MWFGQECSFEYINVKLRKRVFIFEGRSLLMYSTLVFTLMFTFLNVLPNCLTPSWILNIAVPFMNVIIDTVSSITLLAKLLIPELLNTPLDCSGKTMNHKWRIASHPGRSETLWRHLAMKSEPDISKIHYKVNVIHDVPITREARFFNFVFDCFGDF